MSIRRFHRVLFVATALAGSPSGHAAHPLISEDTGTQGRGRTELELGMQQSHGEGAARIRELDPQLSHGVLDELDAIVRPSVLWLGGSAAESAGRRHGFGTTALDVKWRALSSDSFSFGTRAGVDLPTAAAGLGPRQPGVHALLMATYDKAPVMATWNLAYTRAPRDPQQALQRRSQLRVSMGALASVSDDVRLAGDVALAQSDTRDDGRWRAVALVGLIVRTPWRFDVDAGYQFPLNAVASSGVWLVGATLRW